MDGDLGQMLQSVLSDPEQVEKLGQMAKSLMGSLEPPREAAQQEGVSSPPAQPSAAGGLSNADGQMLSSLGKLFSTKETNSRSTALLMAMRPYMCPEKQEKLDKAIKIAQMVHIAGAVMQAYGGGDHGL
jgi:hypothetical protein